MAMIPTFLRSLAAQVRQHVQDKRAVHVTEATAQELELLAGLDWRGVHWAVRHPDDPADALTRQLRPVTPSDITLGWLKASRALTSDFEYDDGLKSAEVAGEAAVDRAAVCAELAVMATQWCEQGRLVKQDGVREVYEVMTASPYDGTIDGARAAWGFVAQCLEDRAPKYDKLLFGTYMRELEGMK